MDFNNKLFTLRKQKGFSQEELANRLNVSRQTISKWEVGESTPDLENLVAISELFEVSLDELVLDKEKEVQPQPAAEGTTKADLYTDLKEHVLTQENKSRAKKGMKIAAIAFGIFLLVDLLSFIIYVSIYGLPQ